ncbi:lipase/acylhydrolase [Clostridia bacterium]|nr:lipase/acylhydrolase [Clostridia bacterium]
MQERRTKKVTIFGDSLFRGIIAGGDRKYVVSKFIDWEAIDRRFGIEIDNRSRMGATAVYGLEQVRKYFQADCECDYAVVEYGGNDSDYDWKDIAGGNLTPEPKTAPETFADALGQILDLLQARGIKPILVSLPPIGSFRYYEWVTRIHGGAENIMRFLKNDVETISRHQEIYNNIVVGTAYARGLDLVDVRQAFLLRPDYAALMCEDGIHPNAAGEQVIVQAFTDKYAARPTVSAVIGAAASVGAAFAAL